MLNRAGVSEFDCDTIRKKLQTAFPGVRGLTIKLVVFTVFFLVSSTLAGMASAQEGHPFKGTWRGTITTGSTTRPLLIIMDYDGENITGMINPGRNSYRFSSTELDASNWLFKAQATTREGVEISLQATLQDVGARNRFLEGAWSEGGSTYPFKITRE